MKKILSGDYSPASGETRIVHMDPVHKEIKDTPSVTYNDAIPPMPPEKKKRGRPKGWKKPAPLVLNVESVENLPIDAPVGTIAFVGDHISSETVKEETVLPDAPKQDAIFATHEELEALRTEILALIKGNRQNSNIEKAGKGNGPKMKEAREKWVGCTKSEKPRMQEIFGSGYVRVWSLIKSLATTVAEQGGIHELDEFNDEFIAQLVNELCDTIERHRKNYIESGRAKNVGRTYTAKIAESYRQKYAPTTVLIENFKETDKEAIAQLEQLSDADFKVFFTKWAIQHHVLLYPDMRRDAMIETFEDYYRINTGDLHRVLAEINTKGADE